MAFGAVGPTVVRSRDAEALIEGRTQLSARGQAGSALKLLDDAIRPIDDLRSNRDYRKKVALNLAGSFLEEVSSI
jgi:CO/xanthine dehydrogenase FAD-binding subunit